MKRPGRPPLDGCDRSVPLTVSLPSGQFAIISAQAKHDRVTVQEWIRRTLQDATRSSTGTRRDPE